MMTKKSQATFCPQIPTYSLTLLSSAILGEGLSTRAQPKEGFLALTSVGLC
jgi:hypothetical protein